MSVGARLWCAVRLLWSFPRAAPAVLATFACLGIASLGLSSIGLSGEARAETAGTSAEERGLAAFETMIQVMQHPRCINCHVVGDVPRQGMERRLHPFGVQRGPTGNGVPGFRCHTCHRDANHDASGVPGGPRWSLAPASTGWDGLEPFEACFALRDPASNGGRTPGAIRHHVENDPLIAWAWSPGLRPDGTPREQPTVSFEHFVGAVSEWARTGAPCP